MWMPAASQRGIVPRDLGAGRAVDDHRVRQVAGVDVPHELLQVRRAAAVASASRHSRHRHGGVGEGHLLRREDAAQAQVEPEVVGQAADLRRELIEEDAADRARPDQADRHRVRRQVEARVHRAQRARRLRLVDDDRDVALGRALRDRRAR